MEDYAARQVLRDACDTCHQLKTRCESSNASRECQRCRRLQLECVYSPSLPLGRPSGTRSSRTAESCYKPETYRFSNKRRRNGTARTNADIESEPETRIFTTTNNDLLQNGFDASTMPRAQDINFTPFVSDGDIGGPIGSSSVNLMDNTAWWVNTLDIQVPFSQHHLLPAVPLGDTYPLNYAHSGNTEENETFPREIHGPFHALLDLQIRLFDLYQSLEAGLTLGGLAGRVSESTSSKAIENAFKATEQFLSLTESLSSVGYRHETLTPQTPTTHQSNLPHVSSMLQLCSCYVRILHIFELLIKTLEKQCRADDIGERSPPYITPPSAPSGSINSSGLSNLPSFRMSDVHLSVPPTATLGMHLVVFNHQIRLLKEAISKVVPTESVLPSAGQEGNSARILISWTLSEVNRREIHLHEAMRTARSIAES